MRLIHTGDLHLGKIWQQESMLEDQHFILMQILDILKREKPDGLIVAGDIYDRKQPGEDAIKEFDFFLSEAHLLTPNIFIISGNHDLDARISFGSRILNDSGIFISPLYNGSISPIFLQDEYGPIYFYLLPYLKPITVSHFLSNNPALTYNESVQVVINQMKLTTAARNVLVMHQFLIGGIRSESEEMNVGGIDAVDANLLQAFDYVALGHLHRQQSIQTSNLVHYAGSPLAYSFSETKDTKSVSLVDIQKKNQITLSLIPLSPLRKVQDIKGTFNELVNTEYINTNNIDSDAYTRITLTDENDIADLRNKLDKVYSHLLTLQFDNSRTRSLSDINAQNQIEKQSAIEIFTDFYENQNGLSLNELQKQYMQNLIIQCFNE